MVVLYYYIVVVYNNGDGTLKILTQIKKAFYLKRNGTNTYTYTRQVDST